MLGFIPKKDINVDYFCAFYEENADILENLLDKAEGSSDLSLEIRRCSDEKILELLDFMDMCEKNYTVTTISLSLETYLHQKEDEVFLDLYMARQEGNLDEWLEGLDDFQYNLLKKCFEKDDTKELFPEVYALINNNEKTK